MFDDVAGPVSTAEAADLLSRFFLHDARAEGLVTDAVRTLVTRGSLERELSPEPRQDTRPKRQAAIENVRRLAREEGCDEEPQPEKTATNPQTKRQQPPAPPQPPQERTRTDRQSNDSSTSSSSSSGTSDSDTDDEDRKPKDKKDKHKKKKHRKIFDGTFRNPKVLWAASRWEREFEAGAAVEDLRRELFRQARVAEQTAGSFTKDVAEDISEVLLEMARAPGGSNKAAQMLLDVLFRTRVFAEGRGRNELEALGRELRDEALPNRFLQARRRAQKEAKREARPTKPKAGFQAPAPRQAQQAQEREQPRQGQQTRPKVEPAVWKSFSRDQQAAVAKAFRT